MVESSDIVLILGCPPGRTRPGDLFPGVLQGTQLTPEDFDLESKVFGDWSWRLKNPAKEPLYREQKEKLGCRIKMLYESGRIRYGEW